MSPKRILIIEDDPDLASLYEYNLQASRYQTLSAYDGRAGLLAAHIWRPDAVILDRTLPDMDGREICKLLRGRGIPTLILTGLKGDPACRSCAECTAIKLAKPSPMSLLLERLDLLTEG